MGLSPGSLATIKKEFDSVLINAYNKHPTVQGSTIIGTLKAGDVVLILSLDRRDGRYVYVLTRSLMGWISGAFLCHCSN